MNFGFRFEFFILFSISSFSLFRSSIGSPFAFLSSPIFLQILNLVSIVSRSDWSRGLSWFLRLIISGFILCLLFLLGIVCMGRLDLSIYQCLLDRAI